MVEIPLTVHPLIQGGLTKQSRQVILTDMGMWEWSERDPVRAVARNGLRRRIAEQQ